MYRKFTADYIFTGHEILRDGEVLITNDEGQVIEITGQQTASEDLERYKGIIVPGFINCHCHLELSHLKNVISAQKGLIDFILQVMKSRNASGEVKQAAMQLAEMEMYDNGIIAIGDICNTTDSLSIKKNSRLHWHNFIEVIGMLDSAAENNMALMNKVAYSFASEHHPIEKDGIKQTTSIAPHAPYSVSKKLFELLNNETAHQLTTIHNQECAAENELYQKKSGIFLSLFEKLGIELSNFHPTGKSSLQSWLPYFTKNQTIILVHNTFTDQDDLQFTRQANINAITGELIQQPTTYFCLCPNANMYIENTIPPIELLRKNNCKLVIGTDSYASNTQLCILEEMKIIQRATNKKIPLDELLGWATINGARALGIDRVVGSFEKGKKPGVVLIDEIHGLQLTEQSRSKRIL